MGQTAIITTKLGRKLKNIKIKLEKMCHLQNALKNSVHKHRFRALGTQTTI